MIQAYGPHLIKLQSSLDSYDTFDYLLDAGGQRFCSGLQSIDITISCFSGVIWRTYRPTNHIPCVGAWHWLNGNMHWIFWTVWVWRIVELLLHPWPPWSGLSVSLTLYLVPRTLFGITVLLEACSTIILSLVWIYHLQWINYASSSHSPLILIEKQWGAFCDMLRNIEYRTKFLQVCLPGC
jgi:hypothetical protein